MARMLPERLPEEIRRDPSLRAEVKTYDALEAALGDEYLVGYDVPWVAAGWGGGVQEGQADFVVVHPDRGVLVLEVKGGEITRDKAGDWYSRDRFGHTHSIKDPFHQGLRTVKALMDKVREIPGFSHTRLSHANGVVFPDVTVPSRLLDPVVKRELVFDAEDLKTLKVRMKQCFDLLDRGPGAAPGVRGAAVLERIIAPTWTAKRLMSLDVRDAEEAIVSLSTQQMRLLRHIAGLRRAAIGGCAGSGKTLLAVEKAAQLASEGMKTALICFNRPLGDFLKGKNFETRPAFVGNIHVLLNLIPGVIPGSDWDWGRIAERVLDLPEDKVPKFDAIVVDEGQDFPPDGWLVVESLLRHASQGILYVFYDDNQALYADMQPDIFEALQPIRLTENWRNTKPIFDVVSRFYASQDVPECLGPSGQPVEVRTVPDSQLGPVLRSTLHELVHTEQIPPSDIIVLSPRKAATSAVPPGTRLGNFVLTERLDSPGNTIAFSTVHRFKGLERPVVILVEMEHAYPEKRSELFYIACSRARSHLVVLAGDAEVNRFVKG